MRGTIAALTLVAGVAFAAPGHAEEADPEGTFSAGTQALREGRAADAIVAFETLADRGVVDAVASFDRGLAYAARVRVGGAMPGDLGRAAQGFEEARDLTRDARLAEDAATALTVVRSEVARRRTQAGEPVDVDPGRSLGRTLAHLLGEDTWSALAVLASGAVSIALFVRWLGRGQRLRVGSSVTAGLSAIVLTASSAMTLARRHDRLDLREAVVVAESARPTDDRGVAVQGASTMPEGARVQVLEARAGSSHYRFGDKEGWLPASSLRELAKP